ncbi:superoxide dismutase family protein [Xanthobacter oligotrophicus]|uniref:superoxide dismutase family protein n=1 Tax=Xanthobacter oligotrophicus TaxID=2607286 RepID=UPI0011F2A5E4|nr:superoxide dismutase family protein [Xanthobacter oligotrophicus]MCG5236140.1 superoxide dismutase family protein [Xanthobacter oligotrophicus]
MGSKQWLLAASILIAGAPAALAQTPAPAAPAAPAPTVVKADLVGNNGKPIGTATATGTDRVTIVRLALQPGAIPPGWHGIHFHAVADCSDTEKFLASKAHVNHGGKAHGLLNPNGPDEGDLPNIFAGADGSVSAEVTSPVGLTGANGLLSATGFALVVHAAPDDHTTQPIGGAGARIACAAFKP